MQAVHGLQQPGTPRQERNAQLSVARWLAAELPVTRQAVSKHLAILARAGLVEAHREGRETRYTIRPERLSEAARAMAQAAEQWDSRLHSIKRLAEARARSTPAAQPPPEQPPPEPR
jgi:DNA-binding transcriptional ArsR family regulator